MASLSHIGFHGKPGAWPQSNERGRTTATWHELKFLCRSGIGPVQGLGKPPFKGSFTKLKGRTLLRRSVLVDHLINRIRATVNSIGSRALLMIIMVWGSHSAPNTVFIQDPCPVTSPEALTVGRIRRYSDDDPESPTQLK